MQIQATTTINEETSTLTFANQQGMLTIVEKAHVDKLPTVTLPAVYLLFSKSKLVDVQTSIQVDVHSKKTTAKIIQLQVPLGIANEEVHQYFATFLTTNTPQPKQPYCETMQLVLHQFGLPLPKNSAQKAKPAGKAQHRWRKEIAEIPFQLNFRGCQATVYWHKRNEMLIKKGATMLAEAPLNKDGSVGLSARMGEQLRQENENHFADFVTIEDMTLRSVNEVGLFLYFAGTNSWLQLIDAQGRTLDELTRVD